MLKELRRPLAILFWLINTFILVGGFFIAHRSTFGNLAITHLSIYHVAAFFLNVVSWLYLSRCFHLFASKRLVMFRDEMANLLKVTALSVLLAAVPILLGGRAYRADLTFLSTLFCVQSIGLISLRYFPRRLLRYFRVRGYNFRQILIVGRNDRAAQLAQAIEKFPELGLKILGFIDAPNGNKVDTHYPFNVLGNLEDFERIIRDNIVDEVFITLPIKSFYTEIEKLIELCEVVGIEAKIPTDIFRIKSSKASISRYLGMAVIDLYTSPKMSIQLFLKRVIDLVFSTILILASLPMSLLVAILIKATSNGPVFFRQQRVGYNGRLFTLYKFRTMVNNAEELKKDLINLNEMDGPVFKINNDPRITRVGRVLRSLSIDELPQLLNVIKGDMSLVGPRPPVPPEVAQYALPDRRRLSMRPGITGIWQVSGRNTIGFEKWMEMDRQYIDQWSLLLDMQILWRTVFAVLKGEGAA